MSSIWVVGYGTFFGTISYNKSSVLIVCMFSSKKYKYLNKKMARQSCRLAFASTLEGMINTINSEIRLRAQQGEKRPSLQYCGHDQERRSVTKLLLYIDYRRLTTTAATNL